jgi:spore germination cell wall hydrolase CwlJ-like protein
MDAQPPKIKTIEVEKEKIIEVDKDPTYKYNISSVEREMLARLVYLEANTESLECQRAVVSVVINRWQDGMWGNTITSVIYYPYQFSPSGLIYKTTPTETNYAAVDQVLKNGTSLPPYVMYFRSGYGFSKTWDEYAEYTQMGDMYFGYFLADK